jgi:hypothetical protein
MHPTLIQLDERLLQKAVQLILSNPATVRNTVSGKRLQVLSPGRFNVVEGPDFIDAAILLNGNIIVGNSEFHRRSSEWFAHEHEKDERYNSVILQIVIENNGTKPLPHEILIISEADIFKALEYMENKKKTKVDVFSIEDLQHFALIRLLRKTTEAQKLINQAGLERAFTELIHSFIDRYNSRRKRPVYSKNQISNMLENFEKTPSFFFLRELSSGVEISIPTRMQLLLKHKNIDEGAHLRREILLNCVLPLSICLANEESRINLFQWFWSIPSLNQYGVLTRRFPNLPQNYLWQQQGMLEYMKEYGKKPTICSDMLKEYGFGEVLSFYRVSGLPVN